MPEGDRQSGPLALLFSRDDAAAFLEQAETAWRALPLTPAARQALEDWHGVVAEARFGFGRTAHARTAVAAHRAGRQVCAALDAAKVDPAAVLSVWHQVEGAVSLAHRLHRAIGADGPWAVPTAQGGWTVETERRSALAGMARHIGAGAWPKAAHKPMSLGFSTLRSLLIRAMRRSGRRWVATGPGKPRFDMIEHLSARGMRRCIVECAGIGLRDYTSLAARLLRILLGKDVPVTLPVVPYIAGRTEQAAVLEALRAVRDPIAQPVLDLFAGRLATAAAIIAAAAEDAGGVLAALRPAFTLSWENNAFANGILTSGAGKAGVRRIAANHNSMPRNSHPVAALVGGGLAKRRVANSLSDIVVAWSPETAALFQELGSLPPKTPILPLDLAQPLSDADFQTPSGPFRILHAGNYQGWPDIFPYIAETSDEFLDGIVRLGRTVSDMPGLEVEVRVRNKGECDLKTVAAAVKPYARIRPVGTGQEFLDHLAQADMLVSFMSTTIEQALQLRKPVLLWGRTERYRHLPASDQPPTADRRSAVYVAHDEAHLRQMLPAIAASHHGRPLRDDELDGYLWQSGRRLGDLAADLAAASFSRTSD